MDKWIECSICGAQEKKMPPHGVGQPCPMAQEEHYLTLHGRMKADEAYIAKLEAERMAFVRQGVASEESARGLQNLMGMTKRLFGDEDEDE